MPNNDSFNLQNKKILVTGASSGIGKEIAIHLSKLGANIFLIARNTEKLEQTIKEMHGEGHSCFSFDLCKTDKISGLFENICGTNLKLDGLVFSAGKDICRPLKLTSQAILQDIMNVNFFSFFEMCRVFSQKKFNNNGGNIVVISSIAAQRGRKGYSAYCASKAAIDGVVRALASELAAIGIRINGIAPSFIDTDMFQKYVSMMGEDVTEKIKERQFLGIGTTTDVSSMVAFLLSDLSRFVTGSILPVDGGYLSH
jgi:NAD(P)-dependent dehydrogenase (short-subunit alcohol dehydrogenase family)